MTKDQWHRVGGNRSKLAALLKDETMVEALGVLRDSEVPVLAPGGAADVLIKNSLEHARQAGFHQAISRLKALAIDPEPEKAPISTRKLRTDNLHEEPPTPK